MNDIFTVAGNLICMQDNSLKPGLWFESAGGNYALWYMSYQWWDYVIFISLTMLVNNDYYRFRVSYILCFLGMMTYILIPNHLSILIWYYWIFEMGCYLAMIHVGHTNKKWEVLIVTLVMLIVWYLVERKVPASSIGYHPFVEIRHFLFALLLIIVYLLMRKFHFGFILLKPFAFFAPISYCIYLLHVPMLKLSRHFFNITMMNLLIAFISTLLLAYVLERKLIKRQKQSCK